MRHPAEDFGGKKLRKFTVKGNHRGKIQLEEENSIVYCVYKNSFKSTVHR